jgi:hypothetical protein
MQMWFNFSKNQKMKLTKLNSSHLLETKRKTKVREKRKFSNQFVVFLNSDGGIIIWGAPKGKKVPDKKEKVFQGEPDMVDYLYEKDAFISKIADSITPTPRAILFIKLIMIINTFTFRNSKKRIFTSSISAQILHAH